MSIETISPPFPQYFDSAGKSLSNGSVFIGEENKDPEKNPITVFWDAALSQPASQPLNTLLEGRVVVRPHGIGPLSFEAKHLAGGRGGGAADACERDDHRDDRSKNGCRLLHVSPSDARRMASEMRVTESTEITRYD